MSWKKGLQQPALLSHQHPQWLLASFAAQEQMRFSMNTILALVGVEWCLGRQDKEVVFSALGLLVNLLKTCKPVAVVSAFLCFERLILGDASPSCSQHCPFPTMTGYSMGKRDQEAWLQRDFANWITMSTMCQGGTDSLC